MTARFILSKSAAIQKYDTVKKFADIISFSHKTNLDVANVLHDNTDCMFSVHATEDHSDISPERIWFFLQSNSDEELAQIFSNKISKFVVDNVNDLKKILDFCERHDKKIWLLLRMRLKEHTVHTGKHFVFGMYSHTVNEWLAKIDKKTVEKLGVHCHRKTQNVSEWSIREELEESIEKWDKIDFVNIGGGIPSEYKNFRTSVIDYVFSQIAELKGWLNKKNVELIIEPGRYIAAPAVRLECDIINMYEDTIVVNCSIFNAAMDTWIANIRLLVEGELDEGTSYTIKGITPDSVDIIRYKVYLNNPKLGDKIVFLNAGAYSFHTDFCGLPKIKTYIIK
jgi:ornithine decarboxylase